MLQLRRNLNQRLKDKAALVQTRMRQYQKFRVALDIAVEQQIEIDRAWAVLGVSDSPQQKLNSQKSRHHLLRSRQRISRLDHHVQEGRLLDLANRLGFVDRRDAADANSRFHHPAHCEQEIPRPVAEIGSQPDVGFGVVITRKHLIEWHRLQSVIYLLLTQTEVCANSALSRAMLH